jgi:CDGSH-type Zn-finger protein
MMKENETPAKIKILKDGPYVVSGHVKLSEKIITSEGRGYVYTEGRELPQQETYALCRCGQSKNPPFCDGAHIKSGFQGAETASRDSFEKRAECQAGPALDLLDDHRCAFARFCHRNDGDVWELTDRSDDPKLRDEAIRAASDCPAGRLVALDKEGQAFEPEYEPGIDIIQDYERGVSGGIFVKGNIPIESADGTLYEKRNRVVLCRCGKSDNKPFCDATHVPAKFLDRE